MKKALIYIFLVFMLFNFSSVLFALKLWQLQAKYQMSLNIEKPIKTESLTAHKSSIKKHLERGSELDWGNKRYDVVKVSYSADSVYIEAVNDTHEEGILHHIGKFLHQQHKEGKKNTRIAALILLVFQAQLPNNFDFLMPCKAIQNDFCNQTFSINKIYKPILSPPPRLA